MAGAGITKTDEADRLEAALERIAKAQVRPSPDRAGAVPALASRLDALIAELRSVLGRDSAD